MEQWFLLNRINMHRAGLAVCHSEKFSFLYLSHPARAYLFFLENAESWAKLADYMLAFFLPVQCFHTTSSGIAGQVVFALAG